MVNLLFFFILLFPLFNSIYYILTSKIFFFLPPEVEFL